MKTNLLKWIMAPLVSLLAMNPGRAKEAALKVGDPAPKLRVSKWVQGEPVKEFQRDKAYIVEFLATWCGPCRRSIPHLNQLYIRLKDKGLVVIGQNVLEHEPDTVEPFVTKMGAQMTYRVALDTDDGKMAQTWLEAASQNGIPAGVRGGQGGNRCLDRPPHELGGGRAAGSPGRDAGHQKSRRRIRPEAEER